ncbi:MAG: energy transducer TonB [Planctomycetes bacterium]|nr:energy transducer TonB [Planctomycetota bacterium]
MRSDSGIRGTAAVVLLGLAAACARPRARDVEPETTAVLAEVGASSGDEVAAPILGQPGTPQEPRRSDPLSAALPRFAGGELPHYPAISRRLGEEGSVVVAVQVRQDGEVVGVVIATSSGVPRLDEAVLAAARTWRFLPRTGERGVDRIAHRFVFRLAPE